MRNGTEWIRMTIVLLILILNLFPSLWDVQCRLLIQVYSRKAKKYYRDVFEVNPTFKESRINLAAILYNEKNYVEALDVILESKVDPYWKRKKQNFSDNYDLYLKTIVNSWIKSVYTDATENERKALDAWKLSFDKKLPLLKHAR